MEPPQPSTELIFADLLRTGDMSGEPYPCAMEGAEEAGRRRKPHASQVQAEVGSTHPQGTPGPSRGHTSWSSAATMTLSPSHLPRSTSQDRDRPQNPRPRTPRAGSHQCASEESGPHMRTTDSEPCSTQLRGSPSFAPRRPQRRLGDLNHPAYKGTMNQTSTFCRRWPKQGDFWP